MRTSVVPGFADVAELLAYVASDPLLFVSSSTAMTSGLVALVASLRVAAWRSERAARLLERIAAPMVLVLAYFGLGSMALASFLYARLHHVLALESEIQLVSGVGHLAVALAGIAVLARPAWRARGWLGANLLAAGYWIAQVAIVRPPWFEFQGHGALTRGLAFALLGASALVTAGILAQRRVAARASTGRAAAAAEPR